MKKFLITICLLLFSSIALADVNFELGPTFLSYDYSYGAMSVLYYRFDNNIDVGLMHTTNQVVQTCDRIDCIHDIKRKLYIFAEYNFKADNMDKWYKRFEFGIGPAYTDARDRVSGTKLNVSVHLGYWLTNNWRINIRHISNAGHGDGYNMGQDSYPMLAVQTNW